MAEPARIRPERDEVPVDPFAVDRAYRLERAKRRAREARLRERQLAGLRFLMILIVLLVASVLLSLTVWQEIERLFGL